MSSIKSSDVISYLAIARPLPVFWKGPAVQLITALSDPPAVPFVMRFATEQGLGVGESVIIGQDVRLSTPPNRQAVCLLRGTN